MSSPFGIPNIGVPSISSLLASSTPVAASTPTPAPSSSLGSSIMQGVMNAATNAATGGILGGIPLQRIIVIIIGLLLIAAGIFAFRPVRETVIETTKQGAKAAALA